MSRRARDQSALQLPAHRRHRRLVRLGALILLAAVTGILAHIVIDATTRDWSFWTYTLASYETATILAIIGIALIWREPPGRNE